MGREYATSYCSQIKDMVQRDSTKWEESMLLHIVVK